MLSLFPALLSYKLAAFTLLRLAAAIVILLLALSHYQNRRELSQIKFIVVGKGMWIPIFAALIEAATGALLFVGLYTQAAAIVGAIIGLKCLIWRRRYPTFFTLSAVASALLFIICLSLITTGPGIFAFDLPL